MIHRIINAVVSTDSFPVAGGSLGAITSTGIVGGLPTMSMVVGTIILAALGAVVGYVVKLIADYIVKKCKN